VEATLADLRAVERLIVNLSPEKRRELEKNPLVAAELKKRWRPTPGPQAEAYECAADELFFGGQAGGGKSSLLVGLSLTAHVQSLVLRRTNVEATKLVEEYAQILEGRDGWNGQDNIWRVDGKVIDIRGCQHEDDKQKFKGAPHDLIGFDEISDFSETQYRFITAWNRSTIKGQRCRVVAAGNPPTTPEGLWVLKYWGAWLDHTHPNPAKPGELRWYTTINGEDHEVDGPGPHLVNGESIIARSRTFIPSSLADNPYLSETNYASVLAALPEELRAAYKEGRFDASLRDHEFQVIPTAWIEAAQNRWKPDGYKGLAMTAMALDPAGGGRDSAELACRYGGWYAPLVSAKGESTADGSISAATVVLHRRDGCPVVIDVGGGFAGAPIERFKDNQIPFRRFDGGSAGQGRAKGSNLSFANKRAEAWWRFREELDPDQEGGAQIAIPPDPELKADLAAPHWELKAKGIQLESKDEIRSRLGRSPGKGDAVVMAFSEGNRAAMQRHRTGGAAPKVVLAYANSKPRR
jgi:hypothetical protein